MKDDFKVPTRRFDGDTISTQLKSSTKLKDGHENEINKQLRTYQSNERETPSIRSSMQLHFRCRF